MKAWLPKDPALAWFAAGCLLSAVLFFEACTPEAPEAQKEAKPVTVKVTRPVKRDVPQYSEYVGRLDGFVNVEIRARVEGFLLRQNFQEGGKVKKGQKLFKIDDREYKSALEKAKGVLAQAHAVYRNAQIKVQRLRPLAKKKAVSRQDLDDAIALRKSALSQIQKAQAELEKAKLALSFTEITSPIDGLAGRSEVRVGNFVGRGEPTLLTTVSQIDPIRLSFSITEREAIQLHRAARGKDKEKAKAQAQARLILSDGSLFPDSGHILFAGRQINPDTGTMELQAKFKNPEGLLRPGQHAQVRVLTKIHEGALIVPQRAVQDMQGSPQLNVLSEKNEIVARPIETGPKLGTWISILEGLKGNQRVVIDGAEKAKNAVRIELKELPSDKLDLPPRAPGGRGLGVGGSGKGGSSNEAEAN